MRPQHSTPATSARRGRLRSVRLLLAVVVLTAVAAGAGCRREPREAGGMSDSTFVATMVELRRLDTALTADSAARATMRGAVLQRRGVTVAELERAATALANDPTHAARVFHMIDSIVTAARRDTTRVVPTNAPAVARTPATRRAAPRGAPAGAAGATPRAPTSRTSRPPVPPTP